MTEDQATAVVRHWGASLEACLNDGIPVGEVVPALLQLTAGCLQGLIGPETSRRDILVLRDRLHKEMTDLANRKQNAG